MSASAAADHASSVGHGAHDDRPVAPDEQFGEASLGKIGMWIFLLSDAFMFAGLLLAYGIMRGSADVWWPAGEPDLGINFTAGLTFLLICSSVTMVLAFASMAENNRKKATLYLALTTLGGILFLCGQYQEYWGIWHDGLTKTGLVFGDSARATTFYVTTSFHGLHVLTGVILLAITTIRTARGKTDSNEVEVVGLFWHFVDLVWILVFTLIYLIPAPPP